MLITDQGEARLRIAQVARFEKQSPPATAQGSTDTEKPPSETLYGGGRNAWHCLAARASLHSSGGEVRRIAIGSSLFWLILRRVRAGPCDVEIGRPPCRCRSTL
jgi:hypothetical protein